MPQLMDAIQGLEAMSKRMIDYWTSISYEA